MPSFPKRRILVKRIIRTRNTSLPMPPKKRGVIAIRSISALGWIKKRIVPLSPLPNLLLRVETQALIKYSIRKRIPIIVSV